MVVLAVHLGLLNACKAATAPDARRVVGRSHRRPIYIRRPRLLINLLQLSYSLLLLLQLAKSTLIFSLTFSRSSSTMEVFNPNPTIFVPTKSRHAQFAKPHSLWLNDPDLEQDTDEDSSDEVEDIDQDEIFGVYPWS